MQERLQKLTDEVEDLKSLVVIYETKDNVTGYSSIGFDELRLLGLLSVVQNDVINDYNDLVETSEN